MEKKQKKTVEPLNIFYDNPDDVFEKKVEEPSKAAKPVIEEEPVKESPEPQRSWQTGNAPWERDADTQIPYSFLSKKSSGSTNWADKIQKQTAPKPQARRTANTRRASNTQSRRVSTKRTQSANVIDFNSSKKNVKGKKEKHTFRKIVIIGFIIFVCSKYIDKQENNTYKDNTKPQVTVDSGVQVIEEENLPVEEIKPEKNKNDSKTETFESVETGNIEASSGISIPDNGEVLFKAYGDNPCYLNYYNDSMLDCCIILKDSKTGKNVLMFYVEAGNTVRVNAPVGHYDIYIYMGEIWYGPDKLFGNCSNSDKPFDSLTIQWGKEYDLN